MKYKLHTTSKKAWDAMFLAISQAEKSIYLEMYIFENNLKKSHNFIRLLKEKASQGISVVIVADAFGSKELKEEIENEKRREGIEFIFFSHWLRHIHRKILVVDEKIAFIGGVNIGKRFRNWNDLQLEIRGRIVKSILKSFAYTYKMAGGKNPKILGFRKREIVLKLRFWLIEHWPAKNIYTLKKHYIEKINQAKNKIQMVTPYFNPPRWLISLLDSAKKRGIEIEILIPKKVDWKIMNVINYHYMNELYPLGIKFHLMDQMNHSKLLIIDGKEGLLGSQNIDLLSFQINAEAGIFFKDKHLLNELKYAINEWLKDSAPFEPHHYKIKFFEYPIIFLLKILRPIL